MNELVIERNPKKSRKILWSGIFITLLSVLLLVAGVQSGQLFILVIGIAGVLFFGMCMVVLIKRNAKSRVVMILSHRGLDDRCAASSVGLIPWHCISSVAVVAIGGQTFLGVYLKDVEGFLQNFSGLRAKAIRANIRMDYPPICITLQEADCNIVDLELQVHQFLTTYGTPAGYYPTESR